VGNLFDLESAVSEMPEAHRPFTLQI
jgi:hypothetical protein